MHELKAFSNPIYIELEWNCSDTRRTGSNATETIDNGLIELDLIPLSYARDAYFLVRPRHIGVSLSCTSIIGINRHDLVGVLLRDDQGQKR